MMDELTLIFAFVLILSSIVLGVGSHIHKNQIAYKERKEARKREDHSANPTESAEKIERLEKRVRVLERLATDRSPDLASEIEDLRGLPDVDLAQSKVERV